jgi:two-component system sensor kinase FixL
MSVVRGNRRITLFYAVFFSLLLVPVFGPGLVQAQHEVQNPLENKNILVLNANESNVPAFQKTDQGLSAALQAGGISISHQFYEHLDLRRNPGPEHRKLIVELMHRRYDRRKIDFIITVYPEALTFLVSECEAIFSGCPVLALYLPEGFKLPETKRRIIPHLFIPDLKRTLEIALKLVPKAECVYVVGGVHPMDRWLEGKAHRDFQEFEDRLEFRYLNDLSLKEILATVSNSPPNSIVYINAFGTDVTGKNLTSVEVGRLVARVSKVPVFGFLDTLLGTGIAGGSLLSLQQVGTKGGEMAVDILSGTRTPENTPSVMEVPQLDMFDWRQLRHWHLSESALPKGSIIINRKFSLWDLRHYAIGALAFIVAQSLLIAGLLWQKRGRRSAEASLRQKSEELDQFFDVSLDLLCIANTDGYFLRLNPIWERTLGYSREDLTAKRFLEFVHPDDLVKTQEAVSALSSQREVISFENRYRCKDGTYRLLEWNAASDGHLIYAAARDVTERRLAQLVLEERLRFEGLISDLSASFVNLPPNKVGNEINRGLRSITEFFDADRCTIGLFSEDGTRLASAFEYRSAEAEPAPEFLTKEQMPWYIGQLIRGNPVIMNRVEDLPPEAENERQLCLSKGMKSLLSIPMLTGNMILGSFALVSVRAERDWPEHLVQRFRLISQVFTSALERKRSEGVLRESEARLNLATTAAGAGLWIIELDTRKVWVSAKTRDLFHFAPDDKLTYEGFFKMIHPDDHKQVHLAFEQALQCAEPLKIDYRIVLPDGSIRWISAHGQRYPSTAPVRLIGVSFDITERLKAETEARQRREELAHMTRISTIGELTTSLAHEINQPLTAIQSNAEAGKRFLSQSTPDISEVGLILEDIIRDDRRAGDVVRKVRALVRKEEPQEEILDLNKTIQDVIGIIWGESLLQGLSIIKELSPTLKPIRGDRVQLQQVILNLILNSAAAMRNAPQIQRKIIVRSVMPDNRSVKVSVTDFGTGIDENNIERLFEPFYTTKPEGLGMGLSISQTIIKAHRGTMEASNNLQGGATFTFTLPIHSGNPL